MFRNNELPNNFNGTIKLNNINYFFDVENDTLRIFFDERGISSVREFNKAYGEILINNVVFGICPDKKRVGFVIGQYNYSAYPDRYSEYKLSLIFKEIYYFSHKQGDFSIKNFNSFMGIKVSGALIDTIMPQSFITYTQQGQIVFDKKIIEKENESIFESNKITIKEDVTSIVKTKFKINHNSFAGETLSSIIQFDFDKNYELFEMTKIYPVIKNFLDLLVTARNTDYKIKLYQKLNDEEIDFAVVKIFNNYKNISNKEKYEVVNFEVIQNKIQNIFNNINNSKYTLCFLPIDNDEYNTINYSSIQNLVTAIELACELDRKCPRGASKIDKANAIYEWCKPYLPIIKDKLHLAFSLTEDSYFALSGDNILKFRQLRHDITHLASGIIDKNMANCYIALKSILYYYLLDVNVEDKERWKIFY